MNDNNDKYSESLMPLNLAGPNEKKNLLLIKRKSREILEEHISCLNENFTNFAWDLDSLLEELDDSKIFSGEKTLAKEYISEIIDMEKSILALLIKLRKKINENEK